MKNITTDPHVYDNYKYADFFINKKTDYYFFGSNLEFSLSHALFSSFEIDSGSRLLLKTLVPFLKKYKPESIMDAGCGTGVLGTALKKSLPDSHLFLYDRDALAVHFSELNLENNNISDYKTDSSLLMFPFNGKKYDLIVSNLPAKAGKEVLGDFIQQSPYHLTEKGIAAVVIVKPLAPFALETINENSLEILEKINTANYSVFIFKYPEDFIKNTVKLNNSNIADNDTENKNSNESIHIKSEIELFNSYIRKEQQLFEIKDFKINIDTATGLPDFDNLSFNTKLAGELISSVKDKISSDNKQLIINPGQGLIPIILKKICSCNEETETIISSNDLLQLKITERNMGNKNLESHCSFINPPTVFHTIDIMEKGSLDSIVYFYSSVPGFKKHDMIIRRLNTILKPGGKLFLISTASEISRFSGCSKGFVNVKGKKNKGIRAVYLKKSAEAE